MTALTDVAPSPQVSFWSPLRNRNFALLWAGQSISLLGDVIFAFSINWLILQKTGSALQIGGNLIVGVIGDVIFSSIAGVLADKWNRRKLLLSSDLLRGGLVLSLALVLWLTPFHIWYVYTCTFLLTVISSFFYPAFQATIPNVLEKDALIAGRSLTVSTSNLLQAIGSALSGLLIVTFSTQWGIVINAISFFLSALAIFLMTIPQHTSPVQQKLTISTLLKNVLDGWRFIRSKTVLLSIFFLFTLADFGAAFIWPLHAVFAEKILKGDSQLYGYLSTASLLGGLVGAFLIGRYNKWFNRHVGLSFLLAASTWGLLSILFGLNSFIPLALGFRFMIGGVLSMIHVPISSLLDASTDDAYRGRVWATIGIGSSIVSVLSIGLSGLVADYWNPRVPYVIAGVLLILTAVLALQLPSIRTAQIDRN